MHRLLTPVFALLLFAAHRETAAGQGLKSSDEKKPKSIAIAEEKAGVKERAEKEKAEKNLTLDQINAIYQLNQLFESIQSIEDFTLKVKTRAQVADALWDYDNAKARQQFQAICHDIDSWQPAQNSADSSRPISPGERIQYYFQRQKLRGEILALIARRDQSMAKGLAEPAVKNVAEQNIDQADMSEAASSMQALLSIQMAESLADTDPQRAAQLARMSLSSGINPALAKVADEIRRKDQRLADNLFEYAISVAKKDPALSTEIIIWMSPYISPDYQPKTFSSAPEEMEEGSTAMSQPNPALVIQFLNFAYSVFIKQFDISTAVAPDRAARVEIASDYLNARKMQPLFERYMPDRAAILLSRLQEVAELIGTNDNQDWLTNISRPSSIQDLVASGETAQIPSQKDELFSRAASLASQRGEFDMALSIAKRINNEQTRSVLDSTIRQRAAVAALSRGEIDLAYAYGKDIADLQKYGVVFSQLAKAFYNKKSGVRAAEIIDEAGRRILKGPEGQDKSRALLALLPIAARIDPVRGFDAMKSAVKAINQAYPVVRNQQAGKATAISDSATARQDSYEILAQSFDQGFALLARIDFYRCLLIAQEIERKPLSVLASLSICHAALVSPAESPDKSKAGEVVR